MVERVSNALRGVTTGNIITILVVLASFAVSSASTSSKVSAEVNGLRDDFQTMQSRMDSQDKTIRFQAQRISEQAEKISRLEGLLHVNDAPDPPATKERK